MHCSIAITLLIVSGCNIRDDYSVEEWWGRVIDVAPDRFSNVRHFTSQGLDYSHHFRFSFTDRTDLDLIVRKHRLTLDTKPKRYGSDSFPHWFDPPTSADAFSNRDDDPTIVLWIDEGNRTAYFELVKI